MTSSLVLWLIYTAYLLVRSYVPGEQGARFGAVIGIVGFIDVPIVAFAIELFPTEHPQPVIFTGGLAPSMALTLMVNIFAFTVLYVFMLLQRINFKTAQSEVKKIRQDLTERFAEVSEEDSHQT